MFTCYVKKTESKWGRKKEDKEKWESLSVDAITLLTIIEKDAQKKG